jgi:hypothetical protein
MLESVSEEWREVKHVQQQITLLDSSKLSCLYYLGMEENATEGIATW